MGAGRPLVPPRRLSAFHLSPGPSGRGTSCSRDSREVWGCLSSGSGTLRPDHGLLLPARSLCCGLVCRDGVTASCCSCGECLQHSYVHLVSQVFCSGCDEEQSLDFAWCLLGSVMCGGPVSSAFELCLGLVCFDVFSEDNSIASSCRLGSWLLLFASASQCVFWNCPV